MTTNLEPICTAIYQNLEELHQAREVALKRSRELTALCAKSIRLIHREQWDEAQEQLTQARALAQTMQTESAGFPPLYFAGYTQDSLKEYVEAELVFAIVLDKPFPSPAELSVEENTWLNGLAEAASELRRRALDLLGRGESGQIEVLRLLDVMDEVYTWLMRFDFSDTLTGGLRRRVDSLRGVLERTRGDVSLTMRQNSLEAALRRLETGLDSAD